MSKGDIDLLMVGDSITHNYENEKVGLKVWEKYFVPLKAINLGFGGDRTGHVLWRLDHLPVMKTAPKGAVVWQTAKQNFGLFHCDSPHYLNSNCTSAFHQERTLAVRKNPTNPDIRFPRLLALWSRYSTELYVEVGLCRQAGLDGNSIKDEERKR